MTDKKTHEIFHRLIDTFDSLNYRHETFDVGELFYLRVLLPLLEEDTGYVLTDLCIIPYDDAFQVAQIYTTMITEAGTGFESLRSFLNQWNLTSLCGAYGIYEKERHLFHKYNVFLHTDSTLEDCLAAFSAGLYGSMEEMSRHLEEAILINNGRP